jgi:hypothetical protein
MLQRILYCFWFGGEMSENRKKCYNSILDVSNVDVQLITDENLNDYVLPEYPLHPGFVFLSDTHKSDYLRSYFMYHYGGGYTDIKICKFDWNPYFEILEQSDKSFAGCPQYSPKHIAYKPYKQHYDKLVGCTNFIFKKHSKFGKLWHDCTNDVIDLKLPLLKEHPGRYHPRAVLGGVQGEPGIFIESLYPFRWTDLLGKIFHKLQYENVGDFLYNVPFPDVTDYR